MVEDERTHGAGLLFVDRHGLPMRGHQVLEVGCLDGAECAAVLEPLTAEAIEVVVDIASAVTGLLERQRLATLPAVNRTLQVVIVYPRLLTALVAGFTNALHFGEKRFADECRVIAGILDSFEPHSTRVVAVLEH
nr:hypothetical protein [Rhodococcus sp. SBT000017]